MRSGICQRAFIYSFGLNNAAWCGMAGQKDSITVRPILQSSVQVPLHFIAPVALRFVDVHTTIHVIV